MKFFKKKTPPEPAPAPTEKTELELYVEDFKTELIKLRVTRRQENMPANLYEMTKEKILRDITKSVERAFCKHVFLDSYQPLLPSEVIEFVWSEISENNVCRRLKEKDVSAEDLALLYFEVNNDN